VSNDKKMVLACIDGSSLREAVCDYAVWIAQTVNVPLKLINTIDHHHETANSSDLSGSFGVDGRDHLLEKIAEIEHEHNKVVIKERKAILQVAKNHVEQAGFSNPDVCLQHGSLIESLIELEKDIRVLVIGARGKIHEDQSDQIGAKLESMIRSLHRPILVAYKKFKKPERIMIAYDGSDIADKALDIVTNSPLYKGLECHLVCVVKKEPADKMLEKAAEKLRAASITEVVCASLQGKAVQELCAYQSKHNIDMTIMGAFSHTRIRDLLLGSFTVKMLLNTKTPLLLLR
jgi:nucleotide-binding universal stress UspA family protein